MKLPYISVFVIGLLSSTQLFAAAGILGASSSLGGNAGRIVSIVDGGAYTYVSGLTSANAIDGTAGIATNYVGLDARPGINPRTISYQLNFAAPYDLGSFVLWNDRDITNTGGTRNNGDGVRFFTLEFFNAANMSLGLERFQAEDLVNQQVFNFASSYRAVGSVKWSILNFYTNGPAHNCASVNPFCNHQWREVGFNYFPGQNDTGVDAVNVPEPATLGLLSLGLSAMYLRRKRFLAR